MLIVSLLGCSSGGDDPANPDNSSSSVVNSSSSVNNSSSSGDKTGDYTPQMFYCSYKNGKCESSMVETVEDEAASFSECEGYGGSPSFQPCS